MQGQLGLELGRPSPARWKKKRKEQTYKPRKVKWRAAGRESEGAVLPMKRGQHNLVEGRASKDHTPLRSRVDEEVRASECRNAC